MIYYLDNSIFKAYLITYYERKDFNKNINTLFVYKYQL
ncbi:conserved hypothetical protein [Clostridium perfringens E str. JGS1987]|uniref:Uncharacterized protein n=1 Tax=Clostridium perfringens E str. JGS1987 TaxID=451755 RepID=B1BSY2_CLOPF|nr:conserved hypothetical protein [Clostridium perfringens E str. JGS1987]